MFNPEEELIKELMRLTGQSKEDISSVLDIVKSKMLREMIMSNLGVTNEENEPGDFEEKDYSEGRYPRYIPAKEVKKYTLRFTLKDIKPSIWRKVEVPSNISLRHLAELIIEVMGWSGYHLNQFRIGNDTYYEPYYQRDGDMESFSFRPIHHFNQEEHTIAEVLSEKGKHIIFEYDFGDSWEHEVRLSSIGEYKDGEVREIKFVGGKRACPPEDCGGIWGYEELCEIAAKKAAGKRLSCDDRERLEWYSDSEDLFDPEFLDLDDCADAVDMLNDEFPD